MRFLVCLALLGAATGCNQLIGDDIDASEPSSSPDLRGTPDDVIGPMASLNCAYQPTSPGVTKGKDLPVIEWQGFRAGSDISGDPTTLASTDGYDCNGSKGVHALVYVLSKYY